MDHAAAFFADVLADPDDLGPRLVYADLLEEQGDPRGAFIRTQIELDQLPTSDPRWPALKERERQLLREHEYGWRGRLPEYPGMAWDRYERGFIEAVRITDWLAFRPHAATVFRANPVRRWLFHCCPLEGAAPIVLAATPEVARLAALELAYNRLEDAGLLLLAASPPPLGRLQMLEIVANGLRGPGLVTLLAKGGFANLRSLNLSRNRLDRSLLDVLRSPALAGLTALDLSYNDLGAIGPEVVEAIAGLTELRELRLNFCRLGQLVWDRPDVMGVWPRLGSLSLAGNYLGPAPLEELARCPALADLEHLDLSRNTCGLSPLVGSACRLGRLAILNLRLAGVQDAGAQALFAAPFFPSLRRLTIAENNLSPTVQRELKARLAHLEELDLRDNQGAAPPLWR